MSRQTVTQQTPMTSPLSPGGILQRKCETCGQHTIAGGQCNDCQKKRLQRRATQQSGGSGGVYATEKQLPASFAGF